MDDLEEKMCSVCYEVKPLSEFSMNEFKNTVKLKDGTVKVYEYNRLNSKCKCCVRAYNREYRRYYYETHKQQIIKENVERKRRNRNLDD